MRQALQSVLIFFFTFVLTLFAITELEKVGVTWRRVPEAAPAQEARARTSPAKVRKMTKKKKVVAATKQRGPKVNETAENRARAAALAARTTFTSLDDHPGHGAEEEQHGPHSSRDDLKVFLRRRADELGRAEQLCCARLGRWQFPP